MGLIYLNAHRGDLALEPSQRAIGLLEGLPFGGARNNLATALGILANAQCALGHFEQASTAAERALEIARELNQTRGIAVCLHIIANILRGEQRYVEADSRYSEASTAARSAGDFGLQRKLIHDQAIMQAQIGNHGRAAELGKEALALCQRAGDTHGEAEISCHLGDEEAQLGNFDVAEAWYKRARELAEKKKHRVLLAGIAQNLGILHQMGAGTADNHTDRDVHLSRAVSLIEDSLDFWQKIDNQEAAAKAYCQLGGLYRMLGEFDRAEEYLQSSLSIRESLSLPDVFLDYYHLAEIARARGDIEAADDWQAKHDAKVAELGRQRRSDGTKPTVPAQMKGALLALARVVHDVRSRGVSLPADASGSLLRLSALPPPMGLVGVFLREVAAGASPAVPSGLPTEVAEILESLRQALRP